MAACDSCGTTILFGGVRDGDRRYCNGRCHEQGVLIQVADRVPAALIQSQVDAVHQGQCPRCGRPGPIDVHLSYRVYSVLVMTSWNSRQHLCCRSCAIKSQLGDVLFCAVLGWWGFPWGLLVTPVQIVRNLVNIGKAPDPSMPSDRLEKIVRVRVAAELVNRANGDAESAE